jgi:hypothetical protein
MNVTAFQPYTFGSPLADHAMGSLRATGTTEAAIVPLWFMDSDTASTIAPYSAVSPSDASVLHVMGRARQLGMTVTLKPQILVRTGRFVGYIQPASVDRWFASYRAMVEHYARLATEGGAQRLVVGTELTSMARYEGRFRAIISAARSLFRGRLTYAADLIDGAERVRFWDALDEVGIDAYMPLAPSVINPSLAQLVAGWSAYRTRIEQLHGRIGKPVLFTELGYQPRVGTTAQPNGVPIDGPANASLQARAYEATFRSWAKVGWFEGIYWWDWPVDTRVVFGTDYKPSSPADAVLRAWNGAAQ